METKAFHPNIEFVLLQLALDHDEEHVNRIDIVNLSQEQRVQLAKFILALPHLEVRHTRVKSDFWKFILATLTDNERKAWCTACKGYINRGVPF
jgi:hypothetical protein